ncbi:MAG: hypothetical protein QGG40_18685, partial [Myxococcota bacterium]|nr:hypothetical protein [Myxococcota bacterium]
MSRWRLLSLVLAGVNVLLGAWLDGLGAGAIVAVMMYVNLFLIWNAEMFADTLGSMGPFRPRITRQSPGSFFQVVGWIGLLAMT